MTQGAFGDHRRDGTMAERLALAVIPGVGWSAAETQAIAREAEAAGFDAIFSAEVNNDVMATAQLMGAATSRIQVGTWIANIYLRHSYTCAQGGALIADATGGRFVLGLGVSHQPINQALGIAMPQPLATLRRYVTEVRSWLRGEGPATHLPQRSSPLPVALSKAWTARGRDQAPELRPVDITLGLPTFIGDDLEALREAARQNLVLYTGLPFFQRLFRDMGFAEEATLMGRGDGMASLSDRLLDAICLIGPLERCQERLAAFREAGVDLPILYPPIGVDGARQVLQAFRR